MKKLVDRGVGVVYNYDSQNKFFEKLNKQIYVNLIKVKGDKLYSCLATKSM